MQSKGIDNRKLTKYLFIFGFIMLLLIIIIRMVNISGSDRLTDMPQVGELSYSPGEIKEKSKIEQFEEEEREKRNKEMGFEENKIVFPTFSEIKKEEINQSQKMTSPAIITEQAVKSSTPGITLPPKNTTSTISNKKLSYHSEYLDTKKDKETDAPPATVSAEPTTPSNPFGTITANPIRTTPSGTAIFYMAEIYGDQKIENGGNVLIRNTEPIKYLDVTIPKNSVLSGQANFQGNRVYVKIALAKTPKGNFPVSLSVQDNDRIEGFYYKAPIDETVDKSKEEVNVRLPGNLGALNQVAETAIRGGKDLMRRSQTLNLSEGYKLYIIPNKTQ